ncbi:hypothetical protein QN277_006405 [Acacia crassicarpa]|uniref:Uncharacterized protein n=1 Tax=Acacia crassicarpa TaxID=499986 RepID=A0AAE1MBQ4_9FABA|nr:hypothetical protein QN277_006405 [Acacia crassicarpa]
MADIAILVAEEYERRLGIIRKASLESHSQERIVEAPKLTMTMMTKPKRESLKWAWEPKSQLAIAASANFFSA